MSDQESVSGERKPGDRIGKYRVLEVLGRGAMGVVYRVEDPTLDRQLALKLIAARGMSEDAKQRFYREARAAAKLNHPNIVTIHELGSEGDQPFIVMELLDGEDLGSTMRRNPQFPVDACLRILIDVCEALEHAHQAGVVHRDVKPGNIHILSSGRAKVMDFGVAKILTEAEGLTKTGFAVGTPQYMSPEQVQGKEVDGRSDIFAAGTVLYQLATRVHPFDADTVTAVFFNIVYKNPAPFSEMFVDHPPGIEQIAFRAMAKDPAQRYQSAAEMGSDLKKVLAGEKIKAIPAGQDRNKRFARWLGAAAAIVILLAALWLLWPYAQGSFGKTRRAAARERTDTAVPTAVDVQDRSIAVKNQRGELLWSYELEGTIEKNRYVSSALNHLYMFCDLTGDGRNDLVFATRYAAGESAANEILFFRHDGKLLRSVKAGREVMRGGEKFESNFDIADMLYLRSRDGAPRVLAVMRHIPFSASLVWLLNASGDRLREYVHEGHLAGARLWDVDKDGYEEVAVGGTSNIYNCPVLVVLDPDTFGGASPSFRGEGSSGSALYYLRLPNLGDDLQKKPRLDAIPHQVYGDRLQVGVADEGNTLFFYFGPRFQSMEAAFDDMTRFKYKRRAEEDPTLPSVPDREKAYLEKIRFWTGKEWVGRPARVSMSPE
jgi:predicted Ser/Thr protein kinase